MFAYRKISYILNEILKNISQIVQLKVINQSFDFDFTFILFDQLFLTESFKIILYNILFGIYNIFFKMLIVSCC